MASVSFGFGKGRIEPVQDAQMALFIINDLAQQGLLQKKADAETTLELAQLITDINNRRVFDFRRRRIYELTRIDEFLRSKGLVEKTDIRVFTTINDNWALAFNPVRFAGTSWFARLQPSVNFSRGARNNTLGNTKTNLSSRGETFILAPVIGVERYIPVNLHWQRNMGANISWSRMDFHTVEKFQSGSGVNEEVRNFAPAAWNAQLFYNVGFFPNNRTIVQAGTELLAAHRVPNNSWNQIKSESEIRPTLNLSADYFISYNTRLSLNVNGAYRYSIYDYKSGETSITGNVHGGFSIGINHIIF
jgi:hypothetical protein